MDATDLMASAGIPEGGRGQGVGTVTGCVWLALVFTTALGAALAMIEPDLAPLAHPHPALRPTAAAILSIATTNARVLAAPFILLTFHFNRDRSSRILGDAIVIALLCGNAIWVGLAIGRWGTILLPYIPQLPIEYLAASVASAAWFAARLNPARQRPVACLLVTALLLVAAAVAEVLLTPHAPV